jgi:hypothetical protein
MSEILEGEYRGNQMLIIRQTPQDKFPFQFGLKKGRLILDHLPEIIEWVAKYDSSFDVNSVSLKRS